ncbi:MAG: hypothetical protein J6X63_05250 [Bacteroidales bacterium]|nr:hypothetical protein [Bacteroidales bacterium]
MEMKAKYLLYLVILSSLFSSCVFDDTERAQRENQSVIENAKNEFELLAKDLRFPESPYSSKETKSVDDNISLNWSYAKTLYGDNITTIVVPFEGMASCGAVITENFGIHKRALYGNYSINSELVMQKSPEDSLFVRFVCTMIGHANGDEQLSFLNDKTLFSGYEILSDEFGKIFSVRHWNNGRKNLLRLRNKKLSWNEKKNNINSLISIGVIISRGNINTRASGDGYATGECDDEYCYSCHSYTHYEDGKCYLCGASMMELVYEFEPFCSICGKIISECTCIPCENCGQVKCICAPVRCALCGDEYCDGSCQNGGNNGGHAGDTNSGSGDNPKKYGTPYSSNPNDVLVDSINESICIAQKDPNTCVFASLEYISTCLQNPISEQEWLRRYFEWLFGISITDNNTLSLYMLHYKEVFDWIIDWIKLVETIALTNAFWIEGVDCLSDTKIKSSIDNNRIVLAIAAYAPNDTDTHALSIIGYTPDNFYIFADPTDGHLYKGELSTFNNSFALIISKVEK